MTTALSILGSTGSIGRQALEVCEKLNIRVTALSCGRDIALLEQQARRFRPAVAAVADENAAAALKISLADTNTRVLAGEEGLISAASTPYADTVLTAVVGTAGLKPTLAAIDSGKRIALANKETLVCAGELVMARAKAAGVEIIPVDSEHSAIFQCLRGENPERELKRIILTASGGPFFGRDRAFLADVRPEDALKHPNWSMGAKITIDSATMMNKGLELIEAMHLFAVPAGRIRILVHRQSVIHSMVEFCDNSVIAQLGTPDMRLPIQLALTWPERLPSPAGELDLAAYGNLSFAEPDLSTFGCLRLAMDAAGRGGVCCASMNAANEAAVALFLQGKIGFLDIYDRVEHATLCAPSIENPTLEDIIAADTIARRIAGREQ